jgi:hypothetical protein
MRRLAAAALVLAVLAVAGSDAGAKQTYCQKTVASEHGNVVWKKHGVTLYRVAGSGGGRGWYACSDAKRSVRPLFSDFSGSAKPKFIRVAAKRCVAVVFKAPGKLPELYMKDLIEKNLIYYGFVIGGDNPKAAVGSLAVSTNCAAAWGESTTDGSGSTTHRIRAAGFSNATSLSRVDVTEVATVKTAADTKHVGIVAAGKRVKVKWTESGAAKHATLP